MINSGAGRTTNNKEDNTMKSTLLLAALIAVAGMSTASAGERLASRGKDNQTQFVRAEARVLGGRADRAAILASTQASPLKAKAASERTLPAQRGKSLGGRNNPR